MDIRDKSTNSGENEPVWVRVAIGGYLAANFATLLTALVRLWPVLAKGDVLPWVEWPWGRAGMPLDARYLLLAATAGALGAYIHLANSFTDYSGNRQLRSSWTWFYLLRGTVGACLAVIVYCALRGGLIQGAGEASSANLNPYGLTAIAGMSGLFSRQATDKLREVFEILFRTDTPNARHDHLVPPPADPPQIP